jgi:Xaa-Pro aminopeptidase
MNEVRQRIKGLRLELLKRDLDAWYISGTDPHGNEYLSLRWQTREFISGFTGSYGLVIVTHEEAGLWTDPRYFIQAAGQLKGSGIKMYKLGIFGALTPESWLSKKLTPGSKLGFDPQTLSVSEYRKLNARLVNSEIDMMETPDLFDYIWKNRPELSDNLIFELPKVYSGLSRGQKLQIAVSEINKNDADLQIITATDELAWIFNLRGSDVPYNPIFTGYGVVGKNECLLFIDSVKVPPELSSAFEREKIVLLDYNEFYKWIKNVRNKRIFIDPSTVNFAVYKSINADNEIIEGISVIAMLKAQKNAIELCGFREVMKKDGAALVEFIYWLKKNAGNKDITEYTAGRKLNEFRSKHEGYIGESFPPIVGYNGHGAIVHLDVSSEDALPINTGGILLFDSGGHYLQGTTDVTRTVILGNATRQQKIDFTLVMKGMIALSLAKFPKGTRGCNLDILARKELWACGLNYGHGTGHGVGHFLNVHEGPVSIRQELNDLPVLPGMVLSNEPGLYREGQYGIRIENIIVCVEREETAFGTFLGFDTLTLCPVDVSLIEMSLLDKREKEWLNSYHHRVRDEIKPLLRKELHGFLDELTAEI